VKTFVYAVPDGIEPGGEILVTIYEVRDFDKPAEPADWTPDEKMDVATRAPSSVFGVRTWGPPLELVGKG